MKKNISSKAFSLVELSIVILIIGVLVAGISQGLDLYEDSKITSARAFTQSSRVNSIKGISLWIDATADRFGVDMSDSDPVQRWNDVNPQTNTKGSFVQSNQSQRPIYKTRMINGLPAVSFDGISQNMVNDSFQDILPNNGITVFLVTRLSGSTPATGVSRVVFSKRVASGSDTSGINTQLVHDSTGFNINSYHGMMFTQSPNVPYVVSYQYGNNTISRSLLNGKGIFNITNGAPPISSTASTDYLYLGKSGLTTIPTTTTFFSGLIGELLIYDRILSKKERQSIESYLGKKWNIKMTVESY